MLLYLRVFFFGFRPHLFVPLCLAHLLSQFLSAQTNCPTMVNLVWLIASLFVQAGPAYSGPINSTLSALLVHSALYIALFMPCTFVSLESCRRHILYAKRYPPLGKEVRGGVAMDDASIPLF
jgi:hypothetical protein